MTTKSGPVAGENCLHFRFRRQFATSHLIESGFKVGALLIAEHVGRSRLRLHGEEDAHSVLLPGFRPRVNAIQNGVDPVFGHGGIILLKQGPSKPDCELIIRRASYSGTISPEPPAWAGKSPELRQPVPHPQRGLGMVQVDARPEGERGKQRGVDCR